MYCVHVLVHCVRLLYVLCTCVSHCVRLLYVLCTCVSTLCEATVCAVYMC